MKQVCQIGIIGVLMILLIAGLRAADRSIMQMTLEPSSGILSVSRQGDEMALSLLGEEYQVQVPVSVWLDRTSLVIQGIKAWVQQ